MLPSGLILSHNDGHMEINFVFGQITVKIFELIEHYLLKKDTFL